MASSLTAELAAAIALTRFGMGARPGELRAVGADARAYLKAQIRPQGADQPANPPGGKLLSTAQIHEHDAEAVRLKRTRERISRQESRRIRKVDYEVEFLARTRLGATTPASFRERWALFWCNHFSVAHRRAHSLANVGSFEREAIRPHVFGKFGDMLLASTRHPTMLIYLDQDKSIGPNSPAGGERRGRRGKPAKRGFNENLAREVMELHSLGVDAGYTQRDVTEFALALTGWGVGGDDRMFVFRAGSHEPGARTVMGKRYDQAGQQQATAALADFAADPRTAVHLAKKIARHFVADNPPPSLVTKLASAYRQSNGNLGRVATALIDAPEAWEPTSRKLKPPYDFVISAWRAAGAVPDRFADVGPQMKALGQEVFDPPSPEGWEDTAEDWAGPGALMERIDWAGAFAAKRTPQGDPVKIARDILGPRLSPAAATAISRAPNRNEAFALLILTPEFQRR